MPITALTASATPDPQEIKTVECHAALKVRFRATMQSSRRHHNAPFAVKSPALA
jgi:hypothetical protein